MKFTMEEMVIMMRALEEYAEFLDDRGTHEPDQRHWKDSAKAARTLLKRIEDAPVEDPSAASEYLKSKNVLSPASEAEKEADRYVAYHASHGFEWSVANKAIAKKAFEHGAAWAAQHDQKETK